MIFDFRPFCVAWTARRSSYERWAANLAVSTFLACYYHQSSFLNRAERGRVYDGTYTMEGHLAGSRFAWHQQDHGHTERGQSSSMGNRAESHG